MIAAPATAKEETYILKRVASDVLVEVPSVVVDAEYDAETLPLCPEAGQRVGNLERHSAVPQVLEDAAS
jgi:hypothetical protein